MATAAAFPAEKKQEFINLLREGFTKTAALRLLDATLSQLRRALATDESFADAYMMLEEEKNEHVKDALYRKAVGDPDNPLSGSVEAQKVWLTSRMAHEFQNSQRIEHVGPGGGPMVMVSATVDALREMFLDPATRMAALDFVEGDLLDEATEVVAELERGPDSDG